jgi:hypothetical protein
MSSDNSRLLRGKINRLTREIGQISEHFYSPGKDSDLVLKAGMLERKRDDMVRSAVLQMHTSIEDLLNSMIICSVLGIKSDDRSRKSRTKSARALRKMLFGAGSLGFDMKLNFAVALKILNSQTKDRLMELNTLRNRCSHNWLLNVPVRYGKRPKQKKPALLLYKNQDLHKVETLKEFTAEYGVLYCKLFLKYPD